MTKLARSKLRIASGGCSRYDWRVMPELAQLDVFFGEVNQHRAIVYARLPRPDGAGSWSLAGTVRGPRCLHCQTLPATAKLVDQGQGPTVLAKGAITALPKTHVPISAR